MHETRGRPIRLSTILRLAVACTGSVLGGVSAHAQTLVGRVVDNVSGAAVSGALVSTLDSVGQPVLRVVANEQGRFAIEVSPAIAQLRIQRMGYRARELSRNALEIGAAPMTITIQSLPMLLQTVEVGSGTSLCEPRADRKRALALFSQVKDGILATVVARSSGPGYDPPQAKIARFDRIVLRANGRIQQQTVLIDSMSAATRPFQIARSAAQLLSDGFVSDSAGVDVYYALDAEVLLSDEFSAGYCFHIEKSDPKHRNQIGLGFTAASTSPGVATIVGTVWVDTVALALDSLEYRYKNAPRALRSFTPGGSMSYQTMPNGAVIMNRWSIRLASIDRASMQNVVRGFGADVHETGGELLRMRWKDGAEWRAKLASASIFIRDSLGNPVPGVRVGLDSTSYRGVSDENGVVEIEDIMSGNYEVFILDSTVPNQDDKGIGKPIPDARLDATDRIRHNITLQYRRMGAKPNSAGVGNPPH